jgi:Lrp/AsnC family transcriptional regulator for asnA, asnC and gidA
MNSKQLDKTDLRILQELKQNCRRSYRELALSTNLSPATLIDRIKKMEKEGVITGYSANFDYLKLGFEFMAIIQIAMKGDFLSIQDKISKLKGVASIYDTTGQYDATAILMCKSRGELSALVKRILAINGVEKTNTNMVLNVVKKLTDFAQI